MLKSIIAAVLMGGLAVSAAAAQDSYPSKDVRFICGFPAGSGADIMVRFFAERIGKHIGHTIIVENKPGAGGMLALTETARAAPDGHTILLAGGNAVAINANLLLKPPVDAGKELTVAATINKMPFVLAVSGKSPYQSLPDLTAAMRKQGTQASYAYSSPFSKVIAESYKTSSGLQTVQVAYQSITDSLNDLASGSINFAIFDPVQGLARQNDGTLRILAISTGERTTATGNLPTFREQGVDIDLPGWWGALVPAATPDDMVQAINEWFKAVLNEPEVRTFLKRSGADPLSLSPKEANAFFRKEIETWGRLVDMVNIEKQ
ncbi:Bug family tripartite tricarboxylate transporter substrate binding protein [Neorhizobium sp. DT-125]|uniref:Bug family tripartite tricarboxylate transporter substrate binding protein n=1 Tax=Neorhizobium sp. DT-125 TaxID=3396163 RepID=UPI003F1D9827